MREICAEKRVSLILIKGKKKCEKRIYIAVLMFG